jgi:hypothetical protein
MRLITLDNSDKSPFLWGANHNQNFSVALNKEANNKGDK